MESHVFTNLTVADLKELVKQSVKEVLNEQKKLPAQPEQDGILSIHQASELLNLALPTIYALTSKKALPFLKKGKKLYFKKSELLQWLNEGRRKTKSEIEQEAIAYLSEHKTRVA